MVVLNNTLVFNNMLSESPSNSRVVRCATDIRMIAQDSIGLDDSVGLIIWPHCGTMKP